MLLDEYLQTSEEMPELASFVQGLLTRYVDANRPLSGYFLICSLMEIQWVVLGQVLAPPSSAEAREAQGEAEAAAANHAWSALAKSRAKVHDVSDKALNGALVSTMNSAIKCFEDLLAQLREMEDEPSLDTYAWETISESLVRYVSLYPAFPTEA